MGFRINYKPNPDYIPRTLRENEPCMECPERCLSTAIQGVSISSVGGSMMTLRSDMGCLG